MEIIRDLWTCISVLTLLPNIPTFRKTLWDIYYNEIDYSSIDKLAQSLKFKTTIITKRRSKIYSNIWAGLGYLVFGTIFPQRKSYWKYLMSLYDNEELMIMKSQKASLFWNLLGVCLVKDVPYVLMNLIFVILTPWKIFTVMWQLYTGEIGKFFSINAIQEITDCITIQEHNLRNPKGENDDQSQFNKFIEKI